MPNYQFECDRNSPVTLYASVDSDDPEGALEELKAALARSAISVISKEEGQASLTGSGVVQYADVHFNKYGVRLDDIVDDIPAAERRKAESMRLPLETFALKIEEDLQEKDKERGRYGWRKTTAAHLLAWLKVEVAKLERAIVYGRGAQKAARDVGALSMMVHDFLVQRNSP